MLGPAADSAALLEYRSTAVFEIARGLLHKGESLVWADQPIVWAFCWGSLPVFLFGVFWNGFLLFWYWQAWRRSPEGALLLFTLPMLVLVPAGIYLLCAPLRAARMARETIYILTDHRAIVWQGRHGRPLEVESFYPTQLANLTSEIYPDGSGTLVFKEYYEDFGIGDGPPKYVCKGFLEIPDAAQVERLIRVTLLEQRVADTIATSTRSATTH